MSISKKIAKALNRGGPSVNHMFFKGKLGSFLKNIASGFTKHTHICYTLKAADVADGVCAVVLDGEYDSVGGIFVLSNAGAPRAITKVEIVEDTEKDGVFYLEITATSIAATDVVHADLYVTE